MSHPVPARRPLTRRAVLGLGTAVAVTTVGLVAPAAAPAYAADTFTCTGPAGVFNSTTAGGTLQWRKLTAPGSTASSWSSATTIGSSGWASFGRVLGGPDGRVYAINANGLHRYRWTGSEWENLDGKQAFPMSDKFVSYGNSTWRNKITVDEIGDFYLVDASGRLKWYRYDEPARKWTIENRTIDTGWDRFDLIVAAGPGVIYARQPDGKLYRYRFDPVSQRWLSRDKYVTAGWNVFTKGMFSVGGDTLFGIKADGALVQYRYREDTNTWPVAMDQIGSGWAAFPNVFASTNTCRLTENFSPVVPVTPPAQYSPVVVMQAPPAEGAALGKLELVYVDNIGRVRHGRQNPDDFGSAQWSTLEEIESSTGRPALVADSAKRVNLFTHQTNGDIRSLTQAAAGSVAWNSWAGQGGAMRSEPSVVQLSDSSMALFALDSDGALWVRPQDGAAGDLLPWTKLGGTGLTGNPVVNAGPDGTATITAIDGTGTVMTATYHNRALTTNFAGVGDTGFTGTPAVVVMPGRRFLIFARHTDGTIKQQYQNADGTWSGTWSPVGIGDITPDGNPAAFLDPNLGRILVVTRTTENHLYQSWETAQGSRTWGNWDLNGFGNTYLADPTIFSYQSSNGSGLAFYSRDINGNPAPFVAPGVIALARKSDTAGPIFTPRQISQPESD
ncbi:tachylectin-related carbohydrate-binding protein [Micromonospora musae]|uniref:tachylectin-related carbohydrate-binding protein n=1 Tax=Micromonospora musae TaxID=1894970 RepID=UPI00340622E1